MKNCSEEFMNELNDGRQVLLCRESIAAEGVDITSFCSPIFMIDAAYTALVQGVLHLDPEDREEVISTVLTTFKSRFAPDKELEAEE